jgi:hypothetical protein
MYILSQGATFPAPFAVYPTQSIKILFQNPVQFYSINFFIICHKILQKIKQKTKNQPHGQSKYKNLITCI